MNNGMILIGLVLLAYAGLSYALLWIDTRMDAKDS
jgi:hypothetical protein